MLGARSHSVDSRTACRRLLWSTLTFLVLGLGSRSLAQPPPPPPPSRVAGGHDLGEVPTRHTLLAQGTDSVLVDCGSLPLRTPWIEDSLATTTAQDAFALSDGALMFLRADTAPGVYALAQGQLLEVFGPPGAPRHYRVTAQRAYELSLQASSTRSIALLLCADTASALSPTEVFDALAASPAPYVAGLLSSRPALQSLVIPRGWYQRAVLRLRCDQPPPGTLFVVAFGAADESTTTPIGTTPTPTWHSTEELSVVFHDPSQAAIPGRHTLRSQLAISPVLLGRIAMRATDTSVVVEAKAEATK